MMCWYCHWGWSQAVQEIYDRYEKLLKSDYPLTAGPSHIVWEDENFEFDHVVSCITESYKNRQRYDTISDKEMDLVRMSLFELLLLSEDERNPIPDNYDDAPLDAMACDYPPKPGVKMVYDRCGCHPR